MFDPKKVAMLILSGKGSEHGSDDTEEDGSSGPGALKAMFAALKDGNEQEAYDAFRSAVKSCGYDDEE